MSECGEKGERMKFLVTFLLGMFVLGGRALGRDRPDRVWWILAACLMVSAALFTYRFA
jgi:hypothetical protein